MHAARSQEKTPLFIHLASSSFVAPAFSSFSLSLLSRRIGRSTRLDVERKRKRDKERENAEVLAVQRRSYSSHTLSQASPVQLAASASSSRSGSVADASQNRRLIDPVFDRPSAFSWSSTCVPRRRQRTYPADGTRGCRTCCVQSWFQPGHPDRPENVPRGRARRARENRWRESAFSRFAGVGQVGRFAHDPPPISCSPPTVRRSTVRTRARVPDSGLESAGSGSWHHAGATDIQAISIFVDGKQFPTFLSAGKSRSRRDHTTCQSGIIQPKINYPKPRINHRTIQLSLECVSWKRACKSRIVWPSALSDGPFYSNCREFGARLLKGTSEGRGFSERRITLSLPPLWVCDRRERSRVATLEVIGRGADERSSDLQLVVTLNEPEEEEKAAS